MSVNTDLKYFKILENEVIKNFIADFPYVPEDASLWKGTHIMYFQEHLFQKTKGNISDRWFYTYFKNEPDKVPRVDMLNILSQYVGYSNWDDFKMQHSDKITTINPNGKILITDYTQKAKKIPLKYIIPFLGLFGIISVLLYKYIDTKNHTYELYFRDRDRISKHSKYMKNLDVILPNYSENPYQTTDSTGKITLTTHLDTLKLVITSPFYKRDTFLINLKLSDKKEIIDLTPDDYAQMMYSYSKSQDILIERRRNRLNQLIADNAVIYQIYDNDSYGQEILSKTQYINLMTTPTESLKNLILLESQSNKNGKIIKIRFKIATNE